MIRRIATGGWGSVVSQPQERAQPPDREIVADRVGLESPLHGQAGQQGTDQHGQLIGSGGGTGSDRRCPAGELTGTEPSGICVSCPDDLRHLVVAGGPEPQLVFEQGPSGRGVARGSDWARDVSPRLPRVGRGGDSLTATSASRTVRTESFHQSNRANRRPCLLPKWALDRAEVRPAASATASTDTASMPCSAKRSAAAAKSRARVSALRSSWVCDTFPRCCPDRHGARSDPPVWPAHTDPTYIGIVMQV